MKKITASILAFSLIALLGVSLVAALPFGFGKGINKDLTQEGQIEFQAFHDAMKQAIEDNDFQGWKTLMQSQLTEENFNLLVERHNEMGERVPGQGMKNGLGNGMHNGKGMKTGCPFAEPISE